MKYLLTFGKLLRSQNKDNSENASPAQVMRGYLPVSDPLSILAPQTLLYLLDAIGSFQHNK